MALQIEQRGSDALLWVKAVPGASRSRISGLLGNRLKIRVAAPPEGGKANAAVCKLLAAALGLKVRDVSIDAGHSHSEKTVRIADADAEVVRKLLDPS